MRFRLDKKQYIFTGRYYVLHTSVVWIWPKTSRSVTGRKSSTLLEPNIGFLRTGSSNGKCPMATYNRTISRSIPAHTITPTISMTTMVIITHYTILYCVCIVYVVYDGRIYGFCVMRHTLYTTVHTQLLSAKCRSPETCLVHRL